MAKDLRSTVFKMMEQDINKEKKEESKKAAIAQRSKNQTSGKKEEGFRSKKQTSEKKEDGYRSKKQISEKEWNIKAMSQYNEIKSKELFPILSTSYGLAISAENDNIKTKPFRDIFEEIRGAMEDHMESGYDRFNYADDYDALK